MGYYTSMGLKMYTKLSKQNGVRCRL